MTRVMTCFYSLMIRPNNLLTIGPAKHSCKKKAIGKFNTVVCIHTGMISLPAFLNNNVATKLIIGHMNKIEIQEIPRTMKNGLSLSGLMIENVFFLAILPTIKKSKIKATGPIIANSLSDAKNVQL